MNTMVPIARRCTGRLGRACARHGLLLLAGIALSVLAVSADAQELQRGAVEHFFGTLIRQTATACPLTSPADQAAFDSCRRRSTETRRSGGSRVGSPLGTTESGRQAPPGYERHPVCARRAVGPVHALFMFTGEYEISFDPTERLYSARAPALFRNALDPGQYPYPFWHDGKKWADYQAANQVTFWIDPAKIRIVMMQFSAQGKPDPRLTSAPHTQPAFDGKWMWTDAQGRTQPRPTLFVGLMSRNNPYLGQLEGTFRTSPASCAKAAATNATPPITMRG